MLLLEWKSRVYGKLQSKFWSALAYAILWSLWLSRNEKNFYDRDVSKEDLCAIILNLLTSTDAIRRWSNASGKSRPSVFWEKPAFN